MICLQGLQTENTNLQTKIAALEGALEQVTQERDELRSAILQMPALIVLFQGKDHVFVLANQPWLDSLGKRDVIGKTVLEVIPELRGQGFLELLDGVFTTGETFIGTAMPLDLYRNGSTTLERRWYTFHYIAHRGPDGKPLGVLVHATDVTSEYLARQEVHRLNTKLRTFLILAENAPDGITVTQQGTIIYANPAFRRMVCRDEGVVGKPYSDLIGHESLEAFRSSESALAREGAWQGLLTYVRPDGSTFFGQLSRFVIHDEEGGVKATGCIVRDLTEQRLVEQEREAFREQVIAAQDRAIRELSSPLMPLADGLVVMPIVGAIDQARSAQIMETLLHGIAAQRARIAILDITGARNVDASVANALVSTAHAASLLGTEVILTGISPEVAQTLVQVGAALDRMKTRGTLQSAVAYAIGRSGARRPG